MHVVQNYNPEKKNVRNYVDYYYSKFDREKGADSIIILTIMTVCMHLFITINSRLFFFLYVYYFILYSK